MAFPNGTPVWLAVYYTLCLCFLFIRMHYPPRSTDGERLFEDYDRWVNRELKAKMATPIVHPNGSTDMRSPSEGTISQQKHIQATLSYQKPVLCPFSFHRSGGRTNSTRIRAHGQQMFVIQDPYHKNTHPHTPSRSSNRYQIWISCRSVYVGPQQLPPNAKFPRAWIQPLMTIMRWLVDLNTKTRSDDALLFLLTFK